MSSSYSADQSAPSRRWMTVTPSNTDNLPAGVRAIWIGGAGDVSLVGDDDVALVFTFAEEQTGRAIPLAPKRINATGTNATGIKALF